MSHEERCRYIVLQVRDTAADGCDRQMHLCGRFLEASGFRHGGENAQGRKVELLHRCWDIAATCAVDTGRFM
jgi:hypothetical protein